MRPELITLRVLRIGGLTYLADVIGWAIEQLPDHDWGYWPETLAWVEEQFGERLADESRDRLFERLYVQEAA